MHAVLQPWTNAMHLDQLSTLRRHRYADRFSVVRVETTGPLAEPIEKCSTVPALLVSMTLRPVRSDNFRLWVNGKVVPTGPIAAFRANVVDLASEPAMWAGSGIHYVHFHIRRSTVNKLAEDLGCEPVGGFPCAVGQEDIVLAQIAKSLLPHLGHAAGPTPLALDHVELLVAAHVMQRYGAARRRFDDLGGGLAAWQRTRAMELLHENLDGTVRLADLARECELSVSHFARSFKTSFGVSCHRWLMEKRIARAQELLAYTRTPLADIATETGFFDQAAFTRTFHRLVGTTPGQWRRENGRRSAE